MKNHLTFIALVAICFAGWSSAQNPTTPSALRNRKDFERWMTELSNWGRWGKDDQLAP